MVYDHRAGFGAMRFGWTASIVPFLFVFSPSLLLQSPSVTLTVIAIAAAVAGVWLVSAGITGYLTRPMAWWARVGFVAAGIALLIPDKVAA